MDVLTFTDAAAFAGRVGPVIHSYPAFASVLASNLDQTIHGPGFQTHWFLIQDGVQPVGAAMHAEPFGLFVTPVEDPIAGMRALADAVQRAGLTLSALNGPAEVLEPFVEAWRWRTGARSRVTGTDRLYEIGSPPPLPGIGSARLATEADAELATAWMREFNVEVMPGKRLDAQRIVRRRLARGRLLFWETADSRVSMAGVSRPIAGVARVGAVFTPRFWRGRGFGAAVTAAATRQGFDDGADRCVLYADLDNPVSNRIYQAIGYRPVGDSSSVRFDPGPAAG